MDRMDRIETAAGARHVPLDIKMGEASDVCAWNRKSLDEPQLPIYATRTDLGKLGVAQVDGAAYAKISNREVRPILWSNFADSSTGRDHGVELAGRASLRAGALSLSPSRE